MKVYNLDKLKAGDIILWHGEKWLSKRIQTFMKLYLKRLNLKYEDRVIYNHTATVIDYRDKLYVVEAMGKGIQIGTFASTYGSDLENIKIITPTEEYSKTEMDDISKYSIRLTFDPTRYDVTNFIYQMIKVLTTRKGKVGEWYGPGSKAGDDRLYCSETSGYLANKVRPGVCEEWYESNPVDIELLGMYDELEYEEV